MKKILITLLVIVAVFCTFAGCYAADKADGGNNSGTNITDDTESGENKGTDDNAGGEDKPQYEIVAPISNGGNFTGGDYN